MNNQTVQYKLTIQLISLIVQFLKEYCHLMNLKVNTYYHKHYLRAESKKKLNQFFPVFKTNKYINNQTVKTYNQVNCVNCPISEGILPLNEFEYKYLLS